MPTALLLELEPAPNDRKIIMTLKQNALLQTTGLIAGIITISLCTNLIITYFSVDILVYAGSATIMGLLIYTIYSVVLSRLEYAESLKKLSNIGQ